PIDVFPTRTSTKGPMSTAAIGALEENRVVQLPHLARSIHDYLFDLLLDSLPLAAQQPHVWRKEKPTVMRGFIQGLGYLFHRFHFDEFPGLQIQALNRRRHIGAATIRTQKYPASSPNQPCSNRQDHFPDAEVTFSDLTEARCESFPPRHVLGRIQNFASLTKVRLRIAFGLKP